MQADHVGELPEQQMQRMLHQLRVRRFAEIECIGDLLVALRCRKRDRSDELHGVFLSLLVVLAVIGIVLLAVLLATRFAMRLGWRGARPGSSGHRSMRTTGRMTMLQRGP